MRVEVKWGKQATGVLVTFMVDLSFENDDLLLHPTLTLRKVPSNGNMQMNWVHSIQLPIFRHEDKPKMWITVQTVGANIY